MWNVTDPARAARIATLTGQRDFIQAIAFSPRGSLLAGVTYHGTVLVFSLAGPARPALTATISGVLADALYPDGRLHHPAAPPCPLCSPASYAVAFTPDGRTLTVVVDRQEMSANSGRDTIFDWHVTGAGTLGAGTAAARDVADFQPVIAPGDRAVLGSPPGSHAWQAWPLPCQCPGSFRRLQVTPHRYPGASAGPQDPVYLGHRLGVWCPRFPWSW